ncbi:MAG: hydrogenase expression/formation protein HypE [Dehalococcoidales bacterium]|nr:hydrogenase expression/formation protein HypE [Dehalococcoidales bacterium]
MPKGRIILGHGSGGKLSHELIESLFLPPFINPILEAGDDSAVFPLTGSDRTPQGRQLSKGDIAFTTDSYVVKPIFWPGGDIGRLAVCGTVNDLAMVGAIPLYLSAAFVIEEGFPISSLRRIVTSIKRAAKEARVKIVAGDTKVVERGGADGLFINTTGIGMLFSGVRISGSNAQPGDMVILSGSIGDHGIAVLSAREGLVFSNSFKSDVAPLNHMVVAMLKTSHKIHTMRDPTRGGLATTLNEIAQQSKVAIRIVEEQIPIRKEVAAACEILGFDPLYVANEGKVVACVAPEDAERVLQVMRKTCYGHEAAIIGEVLPEPKARVVMKTRVGGTRIVDMLTGEMLPRIC